MADNEFAEQLDMCQAVWHSYGYACLQFEYHYAIANKVIAKEKAMYGPYGLVGLLITLIVLFILLHILGLV